MICANLYHNASISIYQRQNRLFTYTFYITFAFNWWCMFLSHSRILHWFASWYHITFPYNCIFHFATFYTSFYVGKFECILQMYTRNTLNLKCKLLNFISKSSITIILSWFDCDRLHMYLMKKNKINRETDTLFYSL